MPVKLHEFKYKIVKPLPPDVVGNVTEVNNGLELNLQSPPSLINLLKSKAPVKLQF